MAVSSTELPRRERDHDGLLAHWQQRTLVAFLAHNLAADRCRSWDTRLGGSVAVLTAVVGTSIFATLNHDPSVTAKIVAGTVSVAAAIAAGIRAFAALPQRIEDYRLAARQYGAIRREIEQIRAVASADGEISVATITHVRTLLDEVAENSPNAPRRIWAKSRRHTRGEFTWWERAIDRLRGLPPRQKFGLHPHENGMVKIPK